MRATQLGRKVSLVIITKACMTHVIYGLLPFHA